MQKSQIRVLWAHNFPPKISSGIFVYILASAMKELGITIDFEYMGNLKVPKEIMLARKRLNDISKNYDIIHAQFGSLCGLLVSKAPGIKILTLRGSDWYGASSGNFSLHGMLQREFTKRSLNKYDGIVVMSQRMHEEVSKYYDGQLITIPDGINLNNFFPIKQCQARKFFGEEKDTSPWILFSSVQGKSALKRYWLAEQAYIEAKKEIPDLKFKFVSGTSHEEMNNIINACNVVLLTSTHEGWPNIIKECLACNLPFVSTDVSDLKQISNKEKSCFVVDKADPKLIAKSIVESINQGKQNALRQYAIPFSADLIAKKLLEFYKLILKK